LALAFKRYSFKIGPVGNAKKALHIRVAGRVQGVGFRHFTCQEAFKLGLVGWVRNLTDGRVEVLVAGSASQVDDLLKNLSQGPPGAQVVSVRSQEVNWQPVKQSFVTKLTSEREWDER
jgi:acylphosphatase